VTLIRKKGSPFWWADVRVAGVRYRESTKQTAKTKAAQYEALLIHKLNLGEISGVRERAPYLRDFAGKFIEHVESSRLSESTKHTYRNGWRLMRDLPIAGMRIDAITTATAAVLQISGSGSKVNSALRTLKRMLSIAADENLIPRAPRIRLAKERQRERLITTAEETLILENAPDNLRDAFMLIFDTGMRPGEACRLRWEAVDFVRGVILVTHGKSRQARRHLPMSSRVLAMLKERAKSGAVWVFPNKAGDKAITPENLGYAFRVLRRRFKMSEEVVLYCARHTFATDFMGATGDLSKTSKTLGHGSIAITTRYLHPAVADLGAIMDARNAERKNGHNFGHTELTVQ